MVDAAAFEALRPHLFGVAYRMLGSAAEADDAVQDAWLRADAMPPDVASQRAWLTTVVTRLCLDRLKSARARREEYVGPWLPEPVPTDAIDTPDAAVLRRESVTLAFLVVLETLTPAERAAFLLHEVFDVGYGEIAATLETSEANVRQLVHRAKRRVAERRPRFALAPERQQPLVERFLAALHSGDPAHLAPFLADDVTFTSDGGGKAVAISRPIGGADAVAKLLAGFWIRGQELVADGASMLRLDLENVNGEPALVVTLGERLETILVLAIEDDRVTAIRAIRNPDKLAWFGRRRATRP